MNVEASNTGNSGPIYTCTRKVCTSPNTLATKKSRREPGEKALLALQYITVYAPYSSGEPWHSGVKLIDAWLTMPLDALFARPSPVVSGSVEKFDDCEKPQRGKPDTRHLGLLGISSCWNPTLAYTDASLPDYLTI